MKFTTKTLSTLALADGQDDRIVFDDDTRGFAVRLRRGRDGTVNRSWLVQYAIAGRTRRIQLGPVSALDLGKARAAARDLLARKRLGQDPAAERDAARVHVAETFGAHLPRYLDFKARSVRPRSYEEIRRHLDANARPLHTRRLADIDRRSAAVLLANLAEEHGPVSGNRIGESLSAYGSWLLREGLIEVNPFAARNRQPEVVRDRVLADAEVKALWNALNDDYGDILKLLLLTAQRREEIGALRWSEIDLDRAVITLSGARTKNGRPHTVPLSPPALALLKRRARTDGHDMVFTPRSDHGFGGWSPRKRGLDSKLKIDPWRVHDLRRTAATGMANLGVQPHVVEAVLNHVSGSKAGVAGVYNRAAYEPEKRRALDLWADHVLTIVEDRAPKVVTRLKRA
jgi:integrase